MIREVSVMEFSAPGADKSVPGLNRDQVRYRIQKFGLHRGDETAAAGTAGRE
jgi:hypothetical protein